MKFNRSQLRRLIRESINELTLVKSGNPGGSNIPKKVINLEISYAFILTDRSTRIVVDEPSEVAGALVALKNLPSPPEGSGPYTHVRSVEDGEQPISDVIQHFDKAEGRYTDHYEPIVSSEFGALPYDTIIDDDDFT